MAKDTARQVKIISYNCSDFDCNQAFTEHHHVLAYTAGFVTQSKVAYMVKILRAMGETGSADVSFESPALFSRKFRNCTVVKAL